MGKDYWLERWEQEETGFHQSDTNPYLCQYWKELYLDQDDTVFVPLCGKSQDMLWLSAQNHKVLGVELSAIAVEGFFKENKLLPDYNCFNQKIEIISISEWQSIQDWNKWYYSELRKNINNNYKNIINKEDFHLLLKKTSIDDIFLL